MKNDQNEGNIAENIGASAKGVADRVSDKLKGAGIDADGAIETAEQRVNDFQDMLIEEIRDRPLRALGWAAAAGFVLGILSAR